MIQVTKVWWDGEKLMAKPIDPTTIYQEPLQREPDFWEGYQPEPTKPAPVQEPVAYRSRLASGNYTYCTTPQFFDNAQPLYTTPPAAQRQWFGLTDEDKLDIELMGGKSDVMLAEMVEAKLKERNV
jgi:hypothetical protein